MDTQNYFSTGIYAYNAAVYAGLSGANLWEKSLYGIADEAFSTFCRFSRLQGPDEDFVTVNEALKMLLQIDAWRAKSGNPREHERRL